LLQAHAALDGAKIEQITGLKGTLNEAEGVFKVASPRGDLPVSVDGWKMPPFMGLTSTETSRACPEKPNQRIASNSRHVEPTQRPLEAFWSTGS
jgi:hypothetical protein